MASFSKHANGSSHPEHCEWLVWHSVEQALWERSHLLWWQWSLNVTWVMPVMLCFTLTDRVYLLLQSSKLGGWFFFFLLKTQLATKPIASLWLWSCKAHEKSQNRNGHQCTILFLFFCLPTSKRWAEEMNIAYWKTCVC